MFVSRKSLIHSLLNGISSSFIVMINENYVQILNTTFRFYNEKSNHILKIVSNWAESCESTKCGTARIETIFFQHAAQS